MWRRILADPDKFDYNFAVSPMVLFRRPLLAHDPAHPLTPFVQDSNGQPVWIREWPTHYAPNDKLFPQELLEDQWNFYWELWDENSRLALDPGLSQSELDQLTGDPERSVHLVHPGHIMLFHDHATGMSRTTRDGIETVRGNPFAYPYRYVRRISIADTFHSHFKFPESEPLALYQFTRYYDECVERHFLHLPGTSSIWTGLPSLSMFTTDMCHASQTLWTPTFSTSA
jgi:hypothetical protein